MGYCLDTGSSRSGIEIGQERSYRMVTSHNTVVDNSETIYRFGSSLSRSKSITRLRMPLPDGQVLHFNADIIDDDIPLLLRLHVMQRHGLILYFHENKLTSGQYPWVLPLKHFIGHTFVKLTTVSVPFSRTELTRLHLHFFHLSAVKLFKLLQRANPEKATPNVKKLLNDILRACSECRS